MSRHRRRDCSRQHRIRCRKHCWRKRRLPRTFVTPKHVTAVVLDARRCKPETHVVSAVHGLGVIIPAEVVCRGAPRRRPQHQQREQHLRPALRSCQPKLKKQKDLSLRRFTFRYQQLNGAFVSVGTDLTGFFMIIKPHSILFWVVWTRRSILDSLSEKIFEHLTELPHRSRVGSLVFSQLSIYISGGLTELSDGGENVFLVSLDRDVGTSEGHAVLNDGSGDNFPNSPSTCRRRLRRHSVLTDGGKYDFLVVIHLGPGKFQGATVLTER